MALIIDPDNLNDEATNTSSTEVFIDTSALTITLNQVGNLSTDGVTLKALYSFLKEEWRNDPHSKNLPAFPFPMVPITDESFEFIEGWNFNAASSQQLIRNAGWTVKNAAGQTTEQWAGIIGLGTIEADDQLYYQQETAGATTDVVLTGQVNQAVQIYSDPNGDGDTADGFDYRTFFKIFGREYQQLYALATLDTIGVTTMQPIAYRFPLSTGADLKISVADTGIDANSDGTADVAPYSGMSITYYSTAQSRNIGGTNYDFGIIIDGNNGTAEEIYEFVQWSLRQDSDIDAGTANIIGETADELLRFVGDSLETLSADNPEGGGDGVYIDNFLVADTNRITFTDNTGAGQTFPFVATLTINFGDNLQNDASAKYWVYFADGSLPATADDWNDTGALLVDDNSAADMTGDVSANVSITHDFNYDGNVQGGRTAGTDASVTVVGIGLETGQYVRANGTITRSTSNSVSLVAALERNYENPV